MRIRNGLITLSVDNANNDNEYAVYHSYVVNRNDKTELPHDINSTSNIYAVLIDFIQIAHINGYRIPYTIDFGARWYAIDVIDLVDGEAHRFGLPLGLCADYNL